MTATTFAVLDFIESGRRVLANYRIDLERVNDDGFRREVIMPEWEILNDTEEVLTKVRACHDIAAVRKSRIMFPEEPVLKARMIEEPNHPPYSFTYLDYERFVEEMRDNKELYGVGVYIDEAYLWGDSRLSQTAYSRLLSYFVFQSRKRDVDLYMTTQQFENVDLRLRRNVESRILCRYNRRTKVLTARILDLRTGMRRRIKIYGPEIYKFYSTYEIPPLQKMHTDSVKSY